MTRSSRSLLLAGAALLALGACRSVGTSAPGTAAGDVADRAGAPALDLAYRVAMPDPASHLYEVALDVGRVAGDTLRLQLPVWSPGRYARMDFARNVQDFAASDGEGKPLAWDKENGSLWRVQARGARTVRVRYRVFANDLSGTFSVLDTAHANWNGASLFVYVPGHKPDPVRLTIAPPGGWTVISGDAVQPGQTEYRFENYDRLIDTPTEVVPAASLVVDTFSVDGRLYRLALHQNGGIPDSLHQRLARDLAAIVRTENRVVGPPPLQRYTFLAHTGYGGGDGMEHLYSTQIISAQRLASADDVDQFASSLGGHEYFHVWNVKRVRPAALGPFDYTREQYQPSLWVAEGWTQYYGDISPTRAGVRTKSAWYATLGGMIRYVGTAPGRLQRSARQASFDAPFFDGAATPMKTNARNTFLTYYYKGASLALLLDLTIRSRTAGAKSLDDVLRLLRQRTWEAPNASYYLQGRGYTEADVERAASDVAGTDLHDWFERYVGGTEELPWDATLALAGLRIVRADDRWTIEESPGATSDQVAVREGWLKGS